MEEYKENLEEYFMKFVVKSKCIYPDMDDCWYWAGLQFSHSLGSSINYGGIRPFKNSRRRVKAHRLSYQLFRGSLTSSQNINHKCDTKYCVNPNHLEIGTQKQNLLDYHRRYKPFINQASTEQD